MSEAAKAGGSIQCPSCGGGGRVMRDGYATRADIAFLEEEVPPIFFKRLADKLRELKRERDSGEGAGNGRLEPALNVSGGVVMGTELTTTHKDGCEVGARRRRR